MSNLNCLFISTIISLLTSQVQVFNVQDPLLYELLSNNDKTGEESYENSNPNDINIYKKAFNQWKANAKLYGNESAVKGFSKGSDDIDTEEEDIKDTIVTDEPILLEVNRIMYTGYPVEIHEVDTDDGYKLTLLRMPLPRYVKSTNEYTFRRKRSRPAVLLLHGLLFSSVCFTYLGPPNALSFFLVDAGFDVWMGSSRGSAFSRHHVSLNLSDNKQKAKFFDYSYEDIGLHDIPVMVDYVLNQTRRTQVHFVGHAQGATAFLVLASMRPNISMKVAAAHLLAPIGYTTFFPHYELQTIANFTDSMYKLATSRGFYESKDFDPTGRVDTGDIQQTTDVDVVLAKIIGLLRNEINFLTTRTAVKQLAHYGQNVRDKAFRRWNYGSNEENIKVYGTQTPTDYDLSNIDVNVTIYYAAFDNLCNERDIIAMAKDIPNCELRRVGIKTFLHEDFVTSREAKKLVYIYIVRAVRYIERKISTRRVLRRFTADDDEELSQNWSEIDPKANLFLIISNLYFLFYFWK